MAGKWTAADIPDQGGQVAVVSEELTAVSYSFAVAQRDDPA